MLQHDSKPFERVSLGIVKLLDMNDCPNLTTSCARRHEMHELLHFPMRGVPLFDEQHVRQVARQMRRHTMFSYSLRELVLPPIRSTRSLVADEEMLVERAGVSSRSARTMSWYDNEKDAYQHHADYLQRLSKLREELIHQEQANLANALDRLRMRSYGKEYVYSRPTQDKKPRNRHSATSDAVSQRKSLLTTFERFQRMRPKKKPPSIMPLEGKSLIDPPLTERHERHERESANQDRHSTAASSVDESVRMNLQRLGGQTIPSIPRQRRAHHRDIFIESSSYRKIPSNDSNNASSAEERVAKMQKQNQKMMKLRHEAREAEKLKLQPESFRLTLNDEDKMNLEKLKEYYCVYYIPAPASSPTTEEEPALQLPAIASPAHTNNAANGSTAHDKTSKIHKNNKPGYKVATDFPIPPTVCNCACRMYVSGNKMEAAPDQFEYSIHKTQLVNDPNVGGVVRKNGYTIHRSDRESSRHTERSEKSHSHDSSDNNNNKTHTDTTERMKIRIDMPSIVYNTIHTPEPPLSSESSSNLAKAFKQKELRQKELSNLMEDVRELNKRTESLTESVS